MDGWFGMNNASLCRFSGKGVHILLERLNVGLSSNCGYEIEFHDQLTAG